MKKHELISQFQNEVNGYYIQKSDLNRLGEMISGTFTTDPSLNHLLGNVSEKVRTEYCRTVYRAMFGDAVMISSDENIDNLLVLCPPGYRGVPTIRFLLSGGLKVAFSIGFDAIKRSIAFEDNAVKIRNRFSTGKTWYLMTFAVRAGKTNQGLGSKIMRPALEWLDRNNYSVYLETHKTVNTEIYEHFGFKIVDTCMIPGTQTKQYGLLR